MNLLPSPLLVVTNRHQARAPLLEVLASIGAAGGRWFWFREKDLDRDARRTLAIETVRVVHGFGGFLTVGSDVALAAAIGADGVHVSTPTLAAAARRSLGTKALIGVSAHCTEDVQSARDAGADYVTLSPIFSTWSKPGYGPALGVEGIKEAVCHRLPVIALAGITPERASACCSAGAAGVAVMGDMMRLEEPNEVRPLLRDYMRALDGARLADPSPLHSPS